MKIKVCPWERKNLLQSDILCCNYVKVLAENSTVKQEHKFIPRQSLNFFEKTIVHLVFIKFLSWKNLFYKRPDNFWTVRQREYPGLLST